MPHLDEKSTGEQSQALRWSPKGTFLKPGYSHTRCPSHTWTPQLHEQQILLGGGCDRESCGHQIGSTSP